MPFFQGAHSLNIDGGQFFEMNGDVAHHKVDNSVRLEGERFENVTIAPDNSRQKIQLHPPRFDDNVPCTLGTLPTLAHDIGSNMGSHGIIDNSVKLGPRGKMFRNVVVKPDNSRQECSIFEQVAYHNVPDWAHTSRSQPANGPHSPHQLRRQYEQLQSHHEETRENQSPPSAAPSESNPKGAVRVDESSSPHFRIDPVLDGGSRSRYLEPIHHMPPKPSYGEAGYDSAGRFALPPASWIQPANVLPNIEIPPAAPLPTVSFNEGGGPCHSSPRSQRVTSAPTLPTLPPILPVAPAVQGADNSSPTPETDVVAAQSAAVWSDPLETPTTLAATPAQRKKKMNPVRRLMTWSVQKLKVRVTQIPLAVR